MSDSARDFVRTLGGLKTGDLGSLREHAGCRLDESVDGFDLFAGLWWPLRERNKAAPRREVAWLVAKLYGYRPMAQAEGKTLGRQLGAIAAPDVAQGEKLRKRFDGLLIQPLDQIEPALQWALGEVQRYGHGVDWVKLIDDLSIWERQSVRARWAQEFLGITEQHKEGERHVD